LSDLFPLAPCRIAKQAAALYTDVLSALQQPPLASHLDKSWTAHAIAKAGMYEAQAILESANAFRTEDHIASEIARLRVHANIVWRFKPVCAQSVQVPWV
jgi:BRO1-like domain